MNKREIIAKVRIGSVVYGTNVDYSDIEYRTIVHGLKSDKLNNNDPNNREISYAVWLSELMQRDAFAVEIAQSAACDVLEYTDKFNVARGIDLFDKELAKSYNSYACVFIQRHQEREGGDHKNLMNACLFAWRGMEIIKGEKHPLMLSPEMQYDFRKIRRSGYNSPQACRYIELLGKY